MLECDNIVNRSSKQTSVEERHPIQIILNEGFQMNFVSCASMKQKPLA